MDWAVLFLEEPLGLENDECIENSINVANTFSACHKQESQTRHLR